MTMNHPHQTAKIYQFPVGGRATAGGLRKDVKPAAALATRVPQTACGEGWYHDAAIREAQDAKWPTEH